MLSKVFLGFALVGSEWVLYFLVILSILSIALIVERWLFFRSATKNQNQFRADIRTAVQNSDWSKAQSIARERFQKHLALAPDFDASLCMELLKSMSDTSVAISSTEILTQIAQDAMLRVKVRWDQNLAYLATIGANAPFVGLFGTVLGVIQAFHDLSRNAGLGAQTVTAGISDALVATAVGIIVAIPAVVAFNLFQKRVKTASTEAEALKSFLIGRIAQFSHSPRKG